MIHRQLPSVAAWGMFTIGLALSAPVPAANFDCPDVEIVQTAEQARRRSAVFWSGKDLPGEWGTPCRIRVQFGDVPSGGSTTYQFRCGEVFGWSMTLTGRRDEMLRDTLPHEVDHMVRASLIRRPIERWLDEGCASLMESAESQSKLRAVSAALSESLITTRWLNAREYPAAGCDIKTLYALGHSLVEYLLSIDTPQKLLEFQKRSGPVESRLQACYGLTVAQLQHAWIVWKEHRAIPTDSPISGESLPTLTVWTADWCGPCRRFHHDLQTDPLFRGELERRFHVVLMPFEGNRSEASRRGISQLPTFEVAGRRVLGYRSQQELLANLAVAASSVLPERTPTDEPVSGSQIPRDNDAALSNDSSPLGPAVPVHPLLSAGDSLVPQMSQGAETPQVGPPSPTQEPPIPSPSGPSFPTHFGASRLLSTALAVLRWTGVVSGTVATGGLAGLAVTLLTLFIQRRMSARLFRSPISKGGDRPAVVAPFPRRLDEARQLLELRQSEGRVAVLDSLRGMFLDDELEKLDGDETATAADFVARLRTAIDARVDEVAPLTTKV